MQLAPDEEVVIEARSGLGPFGGTATLTTRRILLCTADSEESVPLMALTSVRAAFARDFAAAFWGALLLAFAITFAAAYKPLETGVNTLAMGIEKRMSDKVPEGEAYGRFIHVSNGLVWMLMLPLMGWGVYKLVYGLLGETTLVIATASGELRRTARGRHEELLEFGAEVGCHAGR